MVTRRVYVAFFIFVAIYAAAYNGQQELVVAAEGASALFVYPSATHVRFQKRGPSDQLSYRVHAKFPASSVIGWVSQKLQKGGWEPLSHDFLNPNLPSSQVQGWQEFRSGIKDPESCDHVWLGNWRDVSGDVVYYAFRYRQPCSRSDLTELEVSAGFYPAATARELQRAAQQLEKKMRPR